MIENQTQKKGIRKVPFSLKSGERYLSQKEMSRIYLLFNEMGTNYLAFPIKTVQIL